jgi:magnesium and cobalt transporter
VAFNLAQSKDEMIDLIRESRLLRIPVYEENIDNVRGIILAKEFLLSPDLPIAELIRPVHFIPEQASVESLLQHFRSTASQMALVVDEYGGLAGVVSMEDIVEEIVGELYAPNEPHIGGPIRKLDDKSFLVNADLDIDDFCRSFQLTLEETRFNTVGGLIAAELNRVPARGDEISVGPGRLTVVSMRRRRVLKARLELPEPPQENPDLDRLLAGPADSPADISMRGSP